MTYPGGKNGAGVFQAIINQMPPHRRYIEPFAGGAAVLLHKRPAETSLLCDLDGEALTAVAGEARRRGIAIEARETCGIAYLEEASLSDRETLVYCDPPYVLSTRTKRNLYRHEMTDADHSRLLAAVKRLDCLVMVSGYDNLLYRAELGDWRRVDYMAPTRGGPREECLWCNFPEPVTLHDYRYLGDGYRERERIRRKVTRWQDRFAAMPDLERRAVLSALLRIEEATHEARADSGLAREGEGIQRAPSASSSTIDTTGEGERGERPRHKGGFPQSADIAGNDDGPSSRPRAAQ